jgi:hypothetical protein
MRIFTIKKLYFFLIDFDLPRKQVSLASNTLLLIIDQKLQISTNFILFQSDLRLRKETNPKGSISLRRNHNFIVILQRMKVIIIDTQTVHHHKF